jgi:Tfp pilus assembly protein PilF
MERGTLDNLREAVTASRRAIELDPESPEAHASRGLAESLNRNYQDAEKEFRTAMQLNPTLFDACSKKVGWRSMLCGRIAYYRACVRGWFTSDTIRIR